MQSTPWSLPEPGLYQRAFNLRVRELQFSMLTFRIFEEHDITRELDEKIREGLCRCFPKDAQYFSKHRGWKGSFPSWTAVGFDKAGQPAAHAGIIERDIQIDRHPVKALGIQNVYVLPEYRGRSLTSLLMECIIDEGMRRGIEIGLLFCRLHIEKVYTGTGWRKAEVQKIIAEGLKGESAERKLLHDALYWHPLLSETEPSGTVNLMGPDW